MHWPPAGAGNSPPASGEGDNDRPPPVCGRKRMLPLVPAHAEGAPESGRRLQDTPPGREEECTKGESPQKGGERCRRDNAERQCRGDGAAYREKPQKRRGEVQERQCGEGVQGRRCSTPGKAPKKGGKGIGEAMQGRRSRRETMQHTGKKQNRPSKEQGPRPSRKPRLTRKTPAPRKNPSSPEKPRLLWQTPAHPENSGSPGPRLLPEKPRPARIRRKTPTGRCRE